MIEQQSIDPYERSNNKIASEIGRRFREYRIALRLTQKEVARQSGVSVMTIVRFERGEAGTIRLDTFLSLMRTIQRLENMTEVIPEIQSSLYSERRTGRNQRQRVRNRKQQMAHIDEK